MTVLIFESRCLPEIVRYTLGSTSPQNNESIVFVHISCTQITLCFFTNTVTQGWEWQRITLAIMCCFWSKYQRNVYKTAKKSTIKITDQLGFSSLITWEHFFSTAIKLIFAPLHWKEETLAYSFPLHDNFANLALPAINVDVACSKMVHEVQNSKTFERILLHYAGLLASPPVTRPFSMFVQHIMISCGNVSCIAMQLKSSGVVFLAITC